METLKIETGVKEYALEGTNTGKITVRFSPTDMNFAKRLYHAFEALEERQKAYETVPKMGNAKEALEFGGKLDAEMRETIDAIFGLPVCAALFGDVHAYSMSGGLPAWCNLIFAIMDEMDDSFSREQKATNSRVKKYLDKYKK